jgi:hypothetical protein
MVTWKDYFEIAGALLGSYAFFRVVIWLQFRNDFVPIEPARPRSEPSDIQNQAIDTSRLAERVEQVKQNYAAEPLKYPSASKKALLLEERREELVKKGFFHRPPEPKPPEHEQGWLLLAL